MTIQVGHPHECPTFFLCPQGEVNESTGQRVNKFASWRVNKLVSDRSDKSDLSDAAKSKSPLAPFFCQNLRQLRHISIIISVRYNLTDRKNRPFGLKFAWRYAENRIAQRNPLGVGIFTEPYDYTFR